MPAERTNGGAPPESVEEALARAAGHGRLALAETIAACRALADAAALSSGGRSIAEDGPLGLALRTLDELSASLRAGVEAPGTGLLRAVSEALDAEIARWEERGQDDPDARAVLRAYLGVREILWELGVRPEEGRRKGAQGTGKGRGGGRVQRVPIEE